MFGNVLDIIKVLILYIVIVSIFVTLNIGMIQVFNVFDRVIRCRQKNKNLPLLKKISFTKHLRYCLLVNKYFFPIDLTKWLIYDLVNKNPKIQLFGIRCITGYFGEGKTLFAVWYSKYLQKLYMKKWGIKVHIYANFSLRGQDGYIKKWEDLLDLPRYTIVIFDEIQSTFSSALFKDFPLELLWKLTQCRKLGLMVLGTSPVFSRMTIQLRENTDFIIVATNVFNTSRWFRYEFYRAPDYERYIESDLKKLKQVRYKVMNIIADNGIRNMYDTSAVVQRFDIVPEETQSKRPRITQNEIKLIENNLKKFVLEEIKKYKVS